LVNGRRGKKGVQKKEEESVGCEKKEANLPEFRAPLNEMMRGNQASGLCVAGRRRKKTREMRRARLGTEEEV